MLRRVTSRLLDVLISVNARSLMLMRVLFVQGLLVARLSS